MSNLKNMNTALAKAGNVKEVFSLDFVADRVVKNFQAVTGRKDAKNWYESEVLAMMAVFAEKPDLAKCDRMSIWGCMMTAARTGLSIADGHLDLVQYGNILKAEPNYKGMRQQLNRMDEIKFINEAQIVLSTDEFVYDRAENRITKHESKGFPPDKITLEKDIMAAYVRIEFKDGRKVDVVMYRHDLLLAKSKSKNKAEWGPWNTSPGEMCKKSVIKRAKKVYYKPAPFEISDEDLKDAPAVDVDHEVMDEGPAEAPVQEQPKKAEPEPEIQDVTAEEVTEPVKQAPRKKAATNMNDLLNED